MISEVEVLRLHGMGPKVLDLIHHAFADRGLSFSNDVWDCTMYAAIVYLTLFDLARRWIYLENKFYFHVAEFKYDPSNILEVVKEVKLAGMKDNETFPREPSLALERLMTEYGSAVLRTAFFYMGDRYLAEDISQEVFIRAYRNWSKFRRESNVLTWLTKITINVCRDRFNLRSTSEKPVDPLLLKQTTQLDVEEQVLQRIRNTTILNHVMNLPSHYHEVVYLYYYLDLSTGEIAEVIESPEGTIRGRLHRARELLGQNLKTEGTTYEP